MRRISILFLTMVITIVLFTACQATPEKPVVIGKGDGQLEKEITSQESSGQSADIPLSGEVVKETLINSSGNVDLSIDAQVIRYDDMTFPAVIVTPQKFSQEQANNIINAIVKDAVFYNAAQPLSAEQINEKILFYKRAMNEAAEDKKEVYESIISDYEKQLATAPSDQELIPADRNFSKENSGSTAYSESINGKFDRNDQTYHLLIQNSEDGKLSNVYLRAVGSETFSIINRVETDTSEVKISYEQALQETQDLVQSMGAELSLSDAFLAKSDEFENKYAYQFVFTREVDSFHVVYDASVESIDGSEESMDNGLYQAPWPYEQLSITVDENGVQSLDWKGPCKVEETLNENVSILSFSDIMDVFRKMIFIKNIAWETYADGNSISIGNTTISKAVVSVDRITLGLCRVQSGNQFYLIPVWDFYGTVSFLTVDGQTLAELKGAKDVASAFRESLSSLLTINAIDGSIIDRGLGY